MYAEGALFREFTARFKRLKRGQSEQVGNARLFLGRDGYKYHQGQPWPAGRWSRTYGLPEAAAAAYVAEFLQVESDASPAVSEVARG
jgi:hypothetical protein